MDMETFTTIRVRHLPSEPLRRLVQATCFSGATSDWYRPSVKDAHPYKWDYFFWEKPMNLRTLTVKDVSHLLNDEVYCLVMNSSAQAKASDWHRDAVSETHLAEWEHGDFLCFWAIGTFFNGLHLVAWRFHFPTPIEALLWKVAVCGLLGYTIIWVLFAFLLRWLAPTSFAKNILYYVLSLVYASSRLYLTTEAFMGLRALPQGVFSTVNWTGYFPHIH